jgi:hypothetical protein
MIIQLLAHDNEFYIINITKTLRVGFTLLSSETCKYIILRDLYM